MKLIAQGAEAKVYEKNGAILKHRIEKKYRLKRIDQRLRRRRTRAEIRLISRASRAGVNTPQILGSNDKKMTIEMEKICGEKVRDVLEPKICRKIGEQLTKLHGANIVHGDLTTSNMILRKSVVVLIDFGLAEYSKKNEDKAVDIHLFKECLKSKHFGIWEKCWKEFLKSYRDKAILKRLKKVESRGRYKN